MEHEKLAALRAQEKEGRDPTCADETLEYMLNTAEELGAERILEARNAFWKSARARD